MTIVQYVNLMHVFVHFRNRSKDIDIPNYFFWSFRMMAMIRMILCEVKNDKPNVFHQSASDKEWDLK